MAPRTVYLVRHGTAAPSGPSGDRGRTLTAQGRAEFAARAARCAARMKLSRIVSSPYPRAFETAQLLSAATGTPVESLDELASGAVEGAGLLRLARSMEDGTALVGHNPEIADAIAAAAKGGRPVPPGTIAAIELDDGWARLLWLEC